MHPITDLINLDTYIFTTWNTENKTPTQINTILYDNYEELIAETGQNAFIGVKLNANSEITNACGIKDDVPFCIEGSLIIVNIVQIKHYYKG